MSGCFGARERFDRAARRLPRVCVRVCVANGCTPEWRAGDRVSRAAYSLCTQVRVQRPVQVASLARRR